MSPLALSVNYYDCFSALILKELMVNLVALLECLSESRSCSVLTVWRATRVGREVSAQVVQSRVGLATLCKLTPAQLKGRSA